MQRGSPGSRLFLHAWWTDGQRRQRHAILPRVVQGSTRKMPPAELSRLAETLLARSAVGVVVIRRSERLVCRGPDKLCWFYTGILTVCSRQPSRISWTVCQHGYLFDRAPGTTARKTGQNQGHLVQSSAGNGGLFIYAAERPLHTPSRRVGRKQYSQQGQYWVGAL